MPIKLAVFDMAGTTVNDENNAVAASMCGALERAGATLALEAMDPVMGMPKPLAVKALLKIAGEENPAKDRIDAIHHDFQQSMIQHYQTDESVYPTLGTEEAFAALRQLGVKVALDTGFDRPITQAILERLGWKVGEQLDGSITSDEVANGRPAPDMILELMKQLGVEDAAQVAKVGDSMSDVEQGKAAGCGLVAAIAGPRVDEITAKYPDVDVASSTGEFVTMIEQVSAHERTA